MSGNGKSQRGWPLLPCQYHPAQLLSSEVLLNKHHNLISVSQTIYKIPDGSTTEVLGNIRHVSSLSPILISMNLAPKFALVTFSFSNKAWSHCFWIPLFSRKDYRNHVLSHSVQVGKGQWICSSNDIVRWSHVSQMLQSSNEENQDAYMNLQCKYLERWIQVSRTLLLHNWLVHSL